VIIGIEDGEKEVMGLSRDYNLIKKGKTTTKCSCIQRLQVNSKTRSMPHVSSWNSELKTRRKSVSFG